MLRKRVLSFVLLVLASVAVLPALHVADRLQSRRPITWSREALFDTDIEVISWVNYAMYRAGISASPGDVVVGRGGWLYLGDDHEHTVTTMRQGRTSADLRKADDIGTATRAWDQWLKRHGVKLYRILVGPNKTSVYPEYLPGGYRPAAAAPMDALMSQASPWFVDPRPALLNAKPQAGALLYYPTDTHWNELGAAVAFQAFADSVARDAPDLRWPGADTLRLQEVRQGEGGDLARMLRFKHRLSQPEPAISIETAAIETTQHDPKSGRIVRQGGNPQVDYLSLPVRVTARGALNARKVLWLRDSFGTALSPLFAATFSETYQLHWREAFSHPEQLAQLVETWRPDYVFVTVVERSAFSPAFAALPPQAAEGTHRTRASRSP